MTVKEGFSSKEAVALTGVSYRQLDYWTRIGFITPSLRSASGRGSGRLYSFQDLVGVKTAKKLRDAGASIEKIVRSIEYIKNNFPETESGLSEFMFITDGESIFVLTKDLQVVVDTLKGRQLCWNINLGEVEREVSKGVNWWVEASSDG